MNYCINWVKIVANCGLSFFLSLIANITTGNTNALETSLLIAFLYAGLAFFTELKLESEGMTPIQSAISKSLIL